MNHPDYNVAGYFNWDVLVGYKLPFESTDDDISWYVKLVPGVSVGGI